MTQCKGSAVSFYGGELMTKLAVLTSGGDAPGMNAAIRAVVRSALYHGFEPYGVHQGFEGLMAGMVQPMSAGSVADIIQRGGTILQTSRSEKFRTLEGRQKARTVLREREIEHLVIIGGQWQPSRGQ